jgi:hypothetical protein
MDGLKQLLKKNFVPNNVYPTLKKIISNVHCGFFRDYYYVVLCMKAKIGFNLNEFF